MNKQIKILIKKEIFELFFNFKSWLNILLWGLMPYLPQIHDKYHKYIAAMIFSVFAGGQYVYDSYMSDIKFKGAFFLHNIKVDFFQVFFVKLFIAVVLSCLSLLINIPNIVLFISFFDIFWVLPLIISFSTIMYLTSVFSKGAEITSAIISILLTIPVFVFVFKIKFPLLQFAFVSLITCFLLFGSFKISFSKFYRTQL